MLCFDAQVLTGPGLHCSGLLVLLLRHCFLEASSQERQLPDHATVSHGPDPLCTQRFSCGWGHASDPCESGLLLPGLAALDASCLISSLCKVHHLRQACMHQQPSWNPRTDTEDRSGLKPTSLCRSTLVFCRCQVALTISTLK